jgi:uncharacterized membrane protein
MFKEINACEVESVDKAAEWVIHRPCTTTLMYIMSLSPSQKKQQTNRNTFIERACTDKIPEK